MAVAGLERVHVGFACNSRCVFCAQGSLREVAPSESDETVRAVIARAAADGASGICFQGGEPTLRDELVAWVGVAREAGLERVLVQTNGRRLAYAAYARVLVAAGLTGVEVSLAGVAADEHEYHTRSPGSFEHTRRGVRNAVRAGLETTLALVVTRSNFRHLVEAAELGVRLGVGALHASVVAPIGEAAERFAALVPRQEALGPWAERAWKRARALGLDSSVSGLVLCQAGAAREAVAHSGAGGEYGEGCAGCSARDACGGVSAEYARAYGFGELRAIAGEARGGARRDARGDAGTGWTAGMGRIDLRGGGAVRQPC